MVSYYYFVRDMGRASRKSVIYRVKVGTSDREQVKYALVREFCRDCGHYFRIVSDCSDQAIRNLEKRLFPGYRFMVRPLARVTVSISQLYQLIIDDSFVRFEKQLTEKKGFYRFHSIIDPIFHANQSKKKNQSILPTPSRKYLKSGHAAGLDSFLIGSAIVAIIFLLAGFLEGKIVYGF